jgi:DNA polymerase I
VCNLSDFSEIVLLDTEYVSYGGDPVVPVCLCALELRSGRRHRLFFHDPTTKYVNPLPLGSDVLYVAYAAQAEWSTFLSLGWKLPEWVLDLFAEFRCLTNGLVTPDGNRIEDNLIAALTRYGLDSMTVVEKESMRNLILRGHPYSVEEREAILDYCAEDVAALETLLPAMLPDIEFPYALYRGRYSKAVARMEFSGSPIDVPIFGRLVANWDSLKEKIAADVETEFNYGVYDGTHWNDERFEGLLHRIGILDEWPRTPSGLLSTDNDEVFEPMAQRYPYLEPLRQLRQTLNRLRSLSLTVGKDGRNRCSLMPFRSITGRNYPPSSKFIFGPSTWIRSLIKPEPGKSLAYLDWSSAEFGIAAALSGDKSMISAYESGDIYMTFAIQAGAAPQGATKATHRNVRDLFKLVVLATQYGQKAEGLARRIGRSVWQAQQLLDLHRHIYSTYWEWSEWMSQKAEFGRTIETVFGWPMHVTRRTKPNTVSNFPMQANGAEMLRWACCYATERELEIHAPVQDALLVGGSADEIDGVVAATRACMAEASSLVLDGFVLRTDVKIVRYPDRYSDERGIAMWNRVMKLLATIETPAEKTEQEFTLPFTPSQNNCEIIRAISAS